MGASNDPMKWDALRYRYKEYSSNILNFYLFWSLHLNNKVRSFDTSFKSEPERGSDGNALVSKIANDV